MANQTQDGQAIVSLQNDQVRRDGFASVIHHHNQFGAIVRAAVAKSMGLPTEPYSTPLPGSSTVSIKNGISAPGLAIVFLLMAAVGAGCWWLGSRLHKPAPAPSPVVTPAVEPPAPAFDPNEWELHLVPDDEASKWQQP